MNCQCECDRMPTTGMNPYGYNAMVNNDTSSKIPGQFANNCIPVQQGWGDVCNAFQKATSYASCVKNCQAAKPPGTGGPLSECPDACREVWHAASPPSGKGKTASQIFCDGVANGLQSGKCMPTQFGCEQKCGDTSCSEMCDGYAQNYCDGVGTWPSCNGGGIQPHRPPSPPNNIPGGGGNGQPNGGIGKHGGNGQPNGGNGKSPNIPIVPTPSPTPTSGGTTHKEFWKSPGGIATIVGIAVGAGMCIIVAVYFIVRASGKRKSAKRRM